MRIVGGKFSGRQLAAPSPQSRLIRPTSDRLRESLFNILTHHYTGVLHEARVLDLFAGTGALGFEAVSRGASTCLFVDDSVEARGLIRQNQEALGLMGLTRLFRRDARKMGAIGTMEPFTLAFLDPPYGKNYAGPTLSALEQGGWLREGALVIIEESVTAFLDPPASFMLEDSRSYGDTALAFFYFRQKPLP